MPDHRKDKRKDALKLLKEDHDEVRDLLNELDGTSTRAAKTRQRLLREIAHKMKIHTTIEEEIFYPAFREAARKSDDEELFFEALEEHSLVEDFELPRMEDEDPTTFAFSGKASVLKELITHHAHEEEKRMFARCRELMSAEERKELGNRLERRKEELMKELMAA